MNLCRRAKRLWWDITWLIDNPDIIWDSGTVLTARFALSNLRIRLTPWWLQKHLPSSGVIGAIRTVVRFGGLTSAQRYSLVQKVRKQ